MAAENEIAEFTSAIKDLATLLNATADSAAVAAAKKKASDDALVKGTTAAAASMGNAAKGFIGAMATGEGGAKSLGGFIDAAKGGVGALGGFASAAVMASKKIPIAGKMAADLIIAAGKGMSDALLDATKFFLSEVDALGKTFNEFGQIGALGSKGMQGLVDDFKTSGLMMTSYKKIVAENTTTFANFKGSVKGGIDEFVKLSHELTNPDGPGAQLRMLGMSLEQVGEAGASYMALQVKLGRAQTMANTDLTRGTIEYAKSMDDVAKLTGINKKTLEEQQQEAISQNRIAAALYLEKNETVKAEMLAMQQLSQIFGKQHQQGVADLMASKGAALTEAAKQTQLVFAGIGPALAQLGNGKSALDVLEVMQRGERSTRDSRASYERSKTTSNTDYYGSGKSFQEAMLGTERGDVKAQSAKIAADREAGAQDKLTKDVVKSQQAFEDMYKSIQREVIDKLPFAASAIKTFAETAAGATTTMLNMFGPKASSGPLGFGPGKTAPQTAADYERIYADQKKAAPSAPVTAPSAAAAPSAPSAPSATPSSQSSGGTIRGAPAAQAPAAPAATSTASAPSASNLTSGKPLAGLNSEFAAALLAAAADYNAATGNKLQINSAYRDKAKQTDMFEKWKNKGKPNPVVGDPELSRHVRGLAADIQNYNDPKAIAALNAHGFNNTGVRGEPWHFQSAATGGILSGPRSGYSAMLHGTEAVVPLPDGRSIPVSNPGGGGSMEIQAAQLDALEELVSTMKNQVSISSKMLQYSQ